MRRIYLTIMAALISLLLIAQEKKTDVSINLNMDYGGSFWGSPVSWIAGAIIIITILVAISHIGKRQKY